MSELLALVEGEFLVFDCLLDCECGPLVNFQVQVTGVCAERFGVNGCEAELSFVFLREGLEGFRKLSALFWGFSEDVAKRNTGLD